MSVTIQMVLSALKPSDSTSTLTMIFLFLCSLSVKLLAPASLLVLGVLMFYFVYQILFILYQAPASQRLQQSLVA